MGVARSKDPDPAKARAIAEAGRILRALAGSTVHGLSNPGTDGRDEMGVCIEPREYVLGLRPFEHWAFISRRTGRVFLGYLDAQRRGLLGQRPASCGRPPRRRVGPRLGGGMMPSEPHGNIRSQRERTER